ncbi:SAM-dependent methyltransferase [Streptomyces umbrinus]|uniref:SAM-dependent methyltransferase n=1 Tax=Streptomyces umbrinus TaxID=67370 RepID=UPI00167C9AB6|nr:class I SAM-dependent methyltransferase [Streptomyces umbrinus]MCR3731931.1 SAM-dependent methyltransferase [Streptomyces umbrinus]
MSTPPASDAVTRHYQQGDLRRKIDEALDRLYPDQNPLTTDHLRAVDEFHIGGHAATRQIAEHLELQPGLRVLDAGSGLGGPARHLAQQADVDVTGVDLTAEYVAVARWLTDRVGLSDRAHFLQGDVSALPFPGASFDRAWMLHVGMNVKDKSRLFTEIGRVLTDGGLFIVYDVMLTGDPSLVSYPVPWASEPGHSFLARAEEYRSLLRGAGFEMVAEHDRRGQGVQSLRDLSGADAHHPDRASAPGGLPASVNVAMGSDGPIKIANVVQNMEQGLLAPTEMVCRLR